MQINFLLKFSLLENAPSSVKDPGLSGNKIITSTASARIFSKLKGYAALDQPKDHQIDLLDKIYQHH